jgi:perosamine synthetase
MWPRYQLAVYSPIPVGASVRATIAAARPGTDQRPELLKRLLHEYSADVGLLCGSGTQALQLVIASALARFGPGAAVALPAFSCYDLAAAAVGASAPIALYDIDPTTLSPDEESVERALDGGARVVVVASLYGMPVPWEPLRRSAARHGALLIEDAAQGYGAFWHDQPLGTLGDVSVLSFGRGKGWTGGNGGVVLARRGAGAWKMRLPDLVPATSRRELSTVFGLLAQWILGRPSIYGIPRSVPSLGLGETTYHPPVPLSAMTRVAAATLLSTEAASVREADTRRTNANSFLESINGVEGVNAITVQSGGTAGYLRLPLRVEGGIGALGSRAGAEYVSRLGLARSYPTTVAELPVVAERLTGPGRRWPGAEQLVRELITVPTHSRVKPSERRAIERLLRGGK